MGNFSSRTSSDNGIFGASDSSFTSNRNPSFDIQKYTSPTGLYSSCSWDSKTIRRLILAKKLAPLFPGQEESLIKQQQQQQQQQQREEEQQQDQRQGQQGQETEPKPQDIMLSKVLLELPFCRSHEWEECPICFLYYPGGLNRSICCRKGLCTECFLQIKRPNFPVNCPFCNHSAFAVVYTGPRSKEEREKEAEEEQKVIELKIKMRNEEIERDLQRQSQKIKEKQQQQHHSPETFQAQSWHPKTILSSKEESISCSTLDSNVNSVHSVARSVPNMITNNMRSTSFHQSQSEIDLEELLIGEAIRLSLMSTSLENSTSNTSSPAIASSIFHQVDPLIEEASKASSSSSLISSSGQPNLSSLENTNFSSSDNQALTNAVERMIESQRRLQQQQQQQSINTTNNNKQQNILLEQSNFSENDLNQTDSESSTPIEKSQTTMSRKELENEIELESHPFFFPPLETFDENTNNMTDDDNHGSSMLRNDSVTRDSHSCTISTTSKKSLCIPIPSSISILSNRDNKLHTFEEEDTIISNANHNKNDQITDHKEKEKEKDLRDYHRGRNRLHSEDGEHILSAFPTMPQDYHDDESQEEEDSMLALALSMSMEKIAP